MDKHIQLLAKIQDALKIANITLKRCGHDDLVMLLNICVHKMRDEGATPHIQAAIKAIHLEAHNREYLKRLGEPGSNVRNFNVWLAIDEKPYTFLRVQPVAEEALTQFEKVDDGYWKVLQDPTNIEHSVSFFLSPEEHAGSGAPRALAQKTRMSICPTCKVVKKEFEECSKCKKPVESDLKIEAPK
jgi:hypothetical protein